MSLPVLRLVGVVWERLGGHFEGQVLDTLLTVVLVRAGDGIVSIYTVEGSSVSKRWNLDVFRRARGCRVFGGSFADGFGHAAGVGHDGPNGTSDST